MRTLIFFTLAFVLGIPSAWSAGLLDCSKAFETGAFDRQKFLEALDAHEFRDRDGHVFRWDDFELSRVSHSQHGEIKNLGASSSKRKISAQGDLVWLDSYTGYDSSYQKLGLTSQLFEFMKDQLPNGSFFRVEDAAGGSNWGSNLEERANVPIIEKLSQNDPIVSRLWRVYQELIRLPDFKVDYSRGAKAKDGSEEDRVAYGFLLYLADLSTQWGRIARHGNYRRDYIGALAEKYRTRIKRDIPQRIIDEENAILREIPRGSLKDYLTPSIPHFSHHR